MHIYDGKDVNGLEFFKLLIKSDEFCAELGRVVLAAGQLESVLKKAITKGENSNILQMATLGKLISYAKDHEGLKNLIPSLEMLKDQRNYLTHNIYALLSDQIEETILERKYLIDSDVWTYTERACQLRQNLNELAEIVERL